MSCKFVLILIMLGMIDFYKTEQTYIFDVKHQKIKAHFDHILDWERNLPDSNTLGNTKCKFDQVRHKLEIWEAEMSTNKLLFDNPLTNFLYIKLRLVDFKVFRKENSNRKRKTKYIPSQDDLTKSVLLMNDLMENEELSVEDFVATFEAKYESVIFTSSDCLVVANELYNEKYVYLASDWFILAEKKMSVEKCVDDETIFWKLRQKIYQREEVQEVHKFKQLCKNTQTVSNPLSFKNGSLFCKISSLKDNPLLQQKIELLSSEPIIEVYHDFVDEHEIVKLLQVSNNYEFREAEAMNDDGTSEYYGENRLAEDLYLSDEEPYIQRIKEKIEYATGLSMKHAEELEIIKYRSGGLFSPHRDYFEGQPLRTSEYGNRVALGMVFLSSVDVGGNFVLPELDIAVVPKKGNMVVFYNIDKDGNNDRRSLHGGCKVFIGNKIAAVAGTHELDQSSVCKIRTKNT